MPKELPEKLESAKISEIESLVNERLAGIAEQDAIITAAQETKAKLKLELESLQEEGQFKLGIKDRPAPPPVEKDHNGNPVEKGDKSVDTVDNSKGGGVE